jgi:hypothetical protein
MSKLYRFEVRFQTKNEKTGKFSTHPHVEEVFTDTYDNAVRLGLLRLPGEIMRLPVVRVFANRDMR